MEKEYYWKLFHNGNIEEPRENMHYFITLNEGPYNTVEEAFQTLNQYYNDTHQMYCREKFILLEVYK